MGGLALLLPVVLTVATLGLYLAVILILPEGEADGVLFLRQPIITNKPVPVVVLLFSAVQEPPFLAGTCLRSGLFLQLSGLVVAAVVV
jgi:hypothetical protein